MSGHGADMPGRQLRAQEPTCRDRKKFQASCDTAAPNERPILRGSEVVETRGYSGRRERFRLKDRRIGLGP